MPIYDIPFSGSLSAADKNILEVKAGAADPFWVRRIRIQTSKTVTELWKMELRLYRSSTAPTSGSGGSAATPVGKPGPLADADGNLVAEQFNTTALSGGTLETPLSEQFNGIVGSGYEWVAEDQKAEFYVPAGYTALLHEVSGPSGATTVTGTMTVRVGE